MIREIKQNFADISQLLGRFESTSKQGEVIIFEEAVEQAIQLILDRTAYGGKVLFIGNGGSAAIASHMATDLWKNTGLKAMAFNDSTLLTCISNDYGYKHVFEKPIESFGDSQDVLIAISSSGQSENILKGVQAALTKGISVITLTGFKSDNPLRALGEINFYVPMAHYGHVECAHHVLCHSFINIIYLKNKEIQEKAVINE